MVVSSVQACLHLWPAYRVQSILDEDESSSSWSIGRSTVRRCDRGSPVVSSWTTASSTTSIVPIWIGLVVAPVEREVMLASRILCLVFPAGGVEELIVYYSSSTVHLGTVSSGQPFFLIYFSDSLFMFGSWVVSVFSDSCIYLLQI